jgi:hypothetical protein
MRRQQRRLRAIPVPVRAPGAGFRAAGASTLHGRVIVASHSRHTRCLGLPCTVVPCRSSHGPAIGPVLVLGAASHRLQLQRGFACTGTCDGDSPACSLPWSVLRAQATSLPRRSQLRPRRILPCPRRASRRSSCAGVPTAGSVSPRRPRRGRSASSSSPPGRSPGRARSSRRFRDSSRRSTAAAGRRISSSFAASTSTTGPTSRPRSTACR